VTTVRFQVTGLKDVLQVFQQLEEDFGDKAGRSKILIPAVREAMKNVLVKAQALAPKDTGELARTQQVEARRPTRKDKRSKYVLPTDTVIALVTTKAFSKKSKNQFFRENADLYATDKSAYKKKLKIVKKQQGILTDARAIAQEFGAADTPAHPYLRLALESQSRATVDNLKNILVRRMDTFRKKMT